MEPNASRELEDRLLTDEDIRVYDSLKAMLMFRDGANWRVPDEDNHAKVISYVLDTPEKEALVHSLISRDITGFDEVVRYVTEHHSSLKDGVI